MAGLLEPSPAPVAEPGVPQTRLSFTLHYWCLWQSEAAGDAAPWPGGEVLPWRGGSADVGFLPMLQRRRLSPLARAACAVAWRCRSVGGDMPSVFCSSHGESQLYFEMLEGIAAGEEVSPSRFSLCVHNAIAGLSSFHSESLMPYVALAGGTEGVYAAFVEAAGWLSETPKILVLCYEQPLPEAYRPYVENPGKTWALGLVLGQALESGLKLTLARGEGPTPTGESGSGLLAAVLAGRRHSLARPGWRWSLEDA